MFFLLLLACDTITTSYTPACILDKPTLEPAEAAPGESVVLTATPLTTQWDTAVTIGSSRAEITAFNREGCDECDLCIASNECDACGSCDTCSDVCVSCVETITVTVPELSAGTWPVAFLNHHGQSAAANLTVTGPAETGTP